MYMCSIYAVPIKSNRKKKTKNVFVLNILVFKLYFATNNTPLYKILNFH